MDRFDKIFGDSDIVVPSIGVRAMTDAAYYARRERAERDLAESAASAKVRDIHLAMAAKYAELVAANTAPVTQLASYRDHASREAEIRLSQSA